jgi:hypothetical protein
MNDSDLGVPALVGAAMSSCDDERGAWSTCCGLQLVSVAKF